MRRHQLRQVLADDRALAGQQLVQHDAERVEIAALVDASLLSRELLRRRVADLAQEDAGRGESLAASRQVLDDAEVDQLDLRLTREVLGQHQVVGRDVAMDVAVRVQVAQRLEALSRDLEREIERRGPAPRQHLLQGDPFDELHHHVRDALGLDGEVVQLRDVGVLEPDRGAGLAREAPLQVFAVGDLRAHDLDDADLVEQAVADLVDGPHPALLDLLEDLVLTLDLPQGESGHDGGP